MMATLQPAVRAIRCTRAPWKPRFAYSSRSTSRIRSATLGLAGCWIGSMAIEVSTFDRVNVHSGLDQGKVKGRYRAEPRALLPSSRDSNEGGSATPRGIGCNDGGSDGRPSH